ncbi:MAG TPA: chromosomal replication initiator protein DnaA [Planctomycetota bacterium]|nr:chromosomal replication initiator protein DnaA [Planctomycetota bacterium]
MQDPQAPEKPSRSRDEPALVGQTPPGSPGTEESATEAGAGLRQRWSEVQTVLQGLIQREQFETWFRRAELRRIDEALICVAVQNNFTRDWLTKHYQDAIERAAASVFGREFAVEFIVDAEMVGERRARAESEPAVEAAPLPRPAAASDGSAANRLMWASDVLLNPHYRFDSFVVGPCNRFAHAASVGVSESPGKNYNPFFLHGSNGLGKTHLLQSLCYSLLERTPHTRILYLSCETFVNHFISALENGDLITFRNKYRNVDVLVIDDIHVLANKERTQEEFFHTFNTLYNAGKQIVLSSDTSPKEIPTLQERLVSRFKWGLVTEIERPCYETRMAILKRKSRERGHELPDDVARLLAEHIDTNIRELEGAVTRLQGYASLSGQALTPELATRVLRDVFTQSRGQLSMEEILRVVTAHFNMKLSELQSKRRSNVIVFPRQIGMYLIRKSTRHSLEEIGGFFGGRDHSTVLYAIDRIEKQMESDPRTKELVAGFLNQLRR